MPALDGEKGTREITVAEMNIIKAKTSYKLCQLSSHLQEKLEVRKDTTAREIRTKIAT